MKQRDVLLQGRQLHVYVGDFELGTPNDIYNLGPLIK